MLLDLRSLEEAAAAGGSGKGRTVKPHSQMWQPLMPVMLKRKPYLLEDLVAIGLAAGLSRQQLTVLIAVAEDLEAA